MIEFTGERIIPDQVDVDLLNEHLARYVFAARFAEGRRALDAGCGAGYGSAELARTAHSVVGVDVAADAVKFASERYPRPNLRFEQASCAALPHPAGSFDLITAFEVIEHIAEWREFLKEARRALAPNGLFVVSTPNKNVYAESRGTAGANPYHVHEFDFAEFSAALVEVFPSVAMFVENHTECVIFQPCQEASLISAAMKTGRPDPAEAHFFVAVCGAKEVADADAFVYVPRAGNLLHEREHHLKLLEAQLKELLADRDRITELYRAQAGDLERGNRWAEELNSQLAERRARVSVLQDELERSNLWAEGLKAEVDERRTRTVALQEEVERANRWAEDLNQQLTERRERVAALQAEVEVRSRWAGELKLELEASKTRIVALQEEVEERNRWAEGLNAEVAALGAALDRERQVVREYVEKLEAAGAALREIEAIHAMVRDSRWIKLGRKVGLGPAL